MSAYESKIRSRVEVHVKLTEHARRAIMDDGYGIDDILDALQNFKIIERYDNARPFPACLLLCRIKRKPIHIVCALPEDADILIIVTVYIPLDKNWSNYTIRKK
ncbi:MAG: DUF4258 domain-containing protein [Nitrosotalea sp.]